jgi:hypothetical protein
MEIGQLILIIVFFVAFCWRRFGGEIGLIWDDFIKKIIKNQKNKLQAVIKFCEIRTRDNKLFINLFY